MGIIDAGFALNNLILHALREWAGVNSVAHEIAEAFEQSRTVPSPQPRDYLAAPVSLEGPRSSMHCAQAVYAGACPRNVCRNFICGVLLLSRYLQGYAQEQ